MGLTLTMYMPSQSKYVCSAALSALSKYQCEDHLVDYLPAEVHLFSSHWLGESTFALSSIPSGCHSVRTCTA